MRSRWTALIILVCSGLMPGIRAFGRGGERIAPPLLTGISWGPEGRRFACVVEAHGEYDIYVANLRMKSLKAIVHHKDPITGVAFSPDGVRIAYIRVPKNQKLLADVRVVNGNGTDNRAVADGRNRKTLAIETSLCWLPDGKHVMFGAWSDPETTDIFGVYTADIQGEELRRVNSRNEEGFHPRCAPDGKRMLYLGRTEDSPAELVLMNTDSSSRKVLVGDVHRGPDLLDVSCAPAWAPDGNMFAFVEQRPKSSLTSVWIDALRGRIPAEVSPEWLPASAPSWSGDSRRVSFQCGGRHTPATVWVAKAGSLRAGPVLDDNLFNVMPSYSAANDWIAVRTFWLQDGATPEGSLVRLVDRTGKTMTLLSGDPLTLAAMQMRAVPDRSSARELARQLERRGHHSDTTDRWKLLADFYVDNARFADAAEAWGKAADTATDDKARFNARYAQASAWANAGEDQKALDLYFELVDGMSAEQRRKARKHVEGLQKVRDLKVKMLHELKPEPMIRIANIYSKAGCLHQAIKWRCRLIEEFPTYRGIEEPIKKLAQDCIDVPLGSVSWRALNVAIEVLENRERPCPPELLVAAAEANARVARRKRAFDYILRALEAGAPKEIRKRAGLTLLDLADAFLAEADTVETAAKCYRKAASLGYEGTQARACIGLGRALSRSSRHAEAADAYSKALETAANPQVATIAGELTAMCRKELPPEDLTAYKRALAEAYMKSGMTEKAKKLREQL